MNESGAAYPRTEVLLARLRRWAQPIVEGSDFRAYNRQKLAASMDLHEERPPVWEGSRDFPMPEELEAQHSAVMAFYYLKAAADRVQSYDLYFRRFPFRQGEMPHHEHLQNMCDLYFAGFYVFEQRLKTYLNLLKPLVEAKPEIGKVLERYRKDFRQELGPRNDTTHHRPYDDLDFDRLFMVGEIGPGLPRPDIWRREQRAFYRRVTQQWAARARRRSRLLLDYVEVVADYTLQATHFLPEPSDADSGA